MKRMKRVLAGLLSASVLLSGAAYAAPAERGTVRDGGYFLKSADEMMDNGSIAAARDLAMERAELQGAQTKENRKNTDEVPITELPDADFIDGRLLVKVERSVSLMDTGSIFDGIAANVDTLFSVSDPTENDGAMLASAEEPTADWVCVDLLDSVDMLTAWNRLLAEDRVLCVQPDYLVQPADAMDITSYDPYLHTQWWQDEIGSQEAWETTAAGDGIVVAVVDTGVDMDHPDLKNRLVSGYNFVSYEGSGWSSNPDDRDGHGTHVAGIIAAEKNDVGVRGVAYNAKIMPVRVLGEYGGSSSDIATAIRWAAGGTIEGVPNAARKADVFNMSFGGFGYNFIEEEAIAFAKEQGCLMVAAAGNESLPTTFAGDGYFGTEVSPAGFPGVLTVMAMNQHVQAGEDWLAHFSNYDADPGWGQEYEIMAPGVDIYSTGMGGDYVYMSGTSMAAPVVAGAAAVLMGMGCTAEETWELLVSTGAERQGKTQPNGKVQTYPALDLGAAVAMKNAGSTSYRSAPSVTNAYIVPILPSVDLGHGAVNFDGLVGYDSVYYYRDAVVSQLHLSYENFGGAGTVTFTGTVGGRAITTVSEYVVPGDIRSVELQISGTPVTTNGYVEFDLYANGEKLDLPKLQAMDLKIPTMSGYFTDYGSYYAPNTTNMITLDGSSDRGTVWVLDMTMYLPVNTSVRFMWDSGQENVIVYQDGDAYIETSYDGTTEQESTLILQNVEACGAGGFYMLGFGYAEFLGSILYDPYAEWVTWVDQCQIYGGWDSMLQGAVFRLSSFLDCYEYTIDCVYFKNNLVNRCVYSILAVSRTASGNTMVENYEPYDPSSVLTIYANDAVAGSDGMESIGFWDNCVVGSADFCWLNGNGDRTGYPAVVKNLYYQPSDDLWCEFEDFLSCDIGNGSVVTQDIIAASWTSICPVFVVDTDVVCNENPNYDAVDYEIDFHLSTAVSMDASWPWMDSQQDPLASVAEFEVSVDKKTVTARLIAPMRAPDMVNDYRLGGICAADDEENDLYFWATGLMGQVITAPADVESKLMDQMWLNADGSDVTVCWNDERILYTDSAVIFRSTDGADYVQIETVANAAAGTYTDTTAEAGHIYEYLVYILRSGEMLCYGFNQFVMTKGTFHGGEDLIVTVKDSSHLTVGLASAWLAGGTDDCLSYTLPEGMAAAIEFSQQVKASGVSYSAVNHGDGTVTITISSEDESAALAGDDLFTITAESGYIFQKVGDDAVARKGGTVLLWHLGNYTATAAGYRNGQMTGVGIVDEWNESCAIQTGSATAWQMFMTADGWAPAQPSLIIT